MVMSFHLALHVHSLLKKLDGKVQSKIGKILLYIIYVLVILAGCFAFYKTQLYFYLFNTGNWKMAATLPLILLNTIMPTAGTRQW